MSSGGRRRQYELPGLYTNAVARVCGKVEGMAEECIFQAERRQLRINTRPVSLVHDETGVYLSSVSHFLIV